MRAVDFVKYEGLGNDFVVVEADVEDAIAPAEARRICDRRRGVGGDGVIVALPPVTPGAVARMRILNADGSIPEMCGNGIRCLAVHVVAERDLPDGTYVIDTDAGPRACTVDRSRGEVEVDMGIARVDDPVRIRVGDREVALTRADVGNPHAVTFDEVSAEEIARIGLPLATAPEFPRGANVEFVRPRDGAFDVVVWERGVGLTQACGTGACAVVAVAAKAGRAPYGRPVEVHLPGGPLFVTHAESGRTLMRGPARRVFAGRVALDGDRA